MSTSNLMNPAPIWDSKISEDFRRSLVRYVAVKDELWGWPLYGYKPDEMLSKACCAWADFIGGFVLMWNDKFNTDPHPEVVRKARAHWKRWGMSGYEAFITIMNDARNKP